PSGPGSVRSYHGRSGAVIRSVARRSVVKRVPGLVMFLVVLSAGGQPPKDKADDKKAPAKKVEPAALAALRGLGAVVEKTGDDVIAIDLTGAKATDAGLAGIGTLTTLERLDL